MFSLIQRIGRMLLLPLAVLPVALTLLILGTPDVLNLPVLIEAGALLLQHMALFLAIGIALDQTGANRLLVAFSVFIAYVLVLLFAQSVVAGFNYLAGTSLLAEPWMPLIIAGGFLLVCLLLIFLLDRLLNLRGRRRALTTPAPASDAELAELAASYIYALGGAENIVAVDDGTTRLRLTVKESSLVDSSLLATLGAAGVVTRSPTDVRINLGYEAGPLAEALRRSLNLAAPLFAASPAAPAAASGAGTADSPPPAKEPPAPQARPLPKPQPQSNGDIPALRPQAEPRPVDHSSAPIQANDPTIAASINLMIAALGGADNIQEARETATTRVRVIVHDPRLVDEEGLRAAGVRGVMAMADTFHLLLGMNAATYAEVLQARLAE